MSLGTPPNPPAQQAGPAPAIDTSSEITMKYIIKLEILNGQVRFLRSASKVYRCTTEK